MRRLAGEFLYQPVHIQMGKPEEGLMANDDVTQHLILLRSGEEKDHELLNLFKQRFPSNQHLVLIFVARKNTCDFVANMLNREVNTLIKCRLYLSYAHLKSLKMS